MPQKSWTLSKIYGYQKRHRVQMFALDARMRPPRPTYSRHPFFFHQNQMLLRTVNGTIVKLSGANNCWQMHLPLCTLHCTTTFIFLTFQNQDRSMYSTKKWFCRHYTKRELSYFTFRRSIKARAFSFTPPFATASICYDITEVVVRPQEPVDPVEAVEPQDTPQSCRGWDIWPLDLGKSLKVLRP